MRTGILCAMDAVPRKITPVEHIRKNVLDLTQTAFASITGVAQSTVSRWENGELNPDVEEYRRIRQAVVERGSEWNDAWVLATAIEQGAAA